MELNKITCVNIIKCKINTNNIDGRKNYIIMGCWN